MRIDLPSSHSNAKLASSSSLQVVYAYSWSWGIIRLAITLLVNCIRMQQMHDKSIIFRLEEDAVS
jgi:hypothetical protein